MSSRSNGGGSGFFAAITSSFSSLGNAMHKSVNRFVFFFPLGFVLYANVNSIFPSLANSIYVYSLLGYEGLEVINPEGGQEDAEEEARRGRWKQEVFIVVLYPCSQYVLFLFSLTMLQHHRSFSLIHHNCIFHLFQSRLVSPHLSGHVSVSLNNDPFYSFTVQSLPLRLVLIFLSVSIL